MENAVYKMNFDCGRQGSLVGLFVAQKAHVDKLIESGLEVYFGDVLGKHSDIYGSVTKDEITMVSDNQEVIDLIIEHDLSSGYNPFQYLAANYEGSFGDEDSTVGEIIEFMISEKEQA